MYVSQIWEIENKLENLTDIHTMTVATEDKSSQYWSKWVIKFNSLLGTADIGTSM